MRCIHMQFKTDIYDSVKNFIGILTGITLCLHIVLPCCGYRYDISPSSP